MPRLRSSLAFTLAACGPQVPVGGGDSSGSLDETTAVSSLTVASTADDADDDADDDGVIIDDFSSGNPPPPSGCDQDDPCLLDILVVIDNSATMAEPQLALVRSLVPLVRTLEQDDPTIAPVDVQMMFTTTDMGNPMCTPFQQSWYTPAMGAPTTTGCNERISGFTGLGTGPDVREDICTSVCPTDTVPADPFVAFYRDQHANVPEVMPRDIDDDGVLDSPAAQAVACLAPQGINGCGYEAPLEAMLRALDPDAAWNGGDRPFLRPESTVMIVLVTDETDCSMDDYSIVMDPTYQEIKPGSGQPQPSSAICWNAGMACSGPDGAGEYSDCSVTEQPLLPVSRYTDRLVGELKEIEGHDVTMVAITGVPTVTEHNRSMPFEPTAGGLKDLVIRDWRDDDLLPEEVVDGVGLEDLRFEFGVGPGCVSVDGGRAVRGIPNPRIHEVCGALDIDGGFGSGARCCVESVCDPEAGLDCIQGWLVTTDGLLWPPG